MLATHASDGGGAPVLRFFSVNWSSGEDGPGDRVVLFLQGCHLRCPWCHSPHSQPARSPLLFHASLCVRCGACARRCPNGVHRLEGGRHEVDRDSCTRCGLCVDACPQSHPGKGASALRLPTREMSVDDVFSWLLPQLQLSAPRGGLTVSGGEPLLQAEAVRALLRKAKDAGIHTAVETSGDLPPRPVELLAEVVDLWLFGLRSHPRRAGEGPALSPLALANLDRILGSGNRNVRIRVPMIPGHTDSPEAMEQVREAMRERDLRDLECLPWNPDTAHFHEALGLRFELSESVNPSTSNTPRTGATHA